MLGMRYLIRAEIFDMWLGIGSDALNTQLVMLTVHARHKVFNLSVAFDMGLGTGFDCLNAQLVMLTVKE